MSRFAGSRGVGLQHLASLASPIGPYFKLFRGRSWHQLLRPGPRLVLQRPVYPSKRQNQTTFFPALSPSTPSPEFHPYAMSSSHSRPSWPSSHGTRHGHHCRKCPAHSPGHPAFKFRAALIAPPSSPSSVLQCSPSTIASCPRPYNSTRLPPKTLSVDALAP